MSRQAINKFYAVLLAAFTAASCATYTSNIRKASSHFSIGNYDQALQILEQEYALHPRNSEIKTLLYRARINCYYSHLAKAREQIAGGDRAAARSEYQRALELFPGNIRLKEEMEAQLAEKKKEEKKAKSYIEPPIQLAVNPSAKLELNLSNTPITNIFKALGKNFNINFIFDREFRDFIHSIDIKNKNFFEILHMLCMIANAEYRIVDTSTVLIYPDQPYKKALFDLKAIKTFYLTHIKAEDAKKLLMPLFTTSGQGTQIQEDTNTNALIIKSDIGTLKEIEQFIPNIDIEKSEVEINVEIIEINRSLIQKLGADFGSNIVTGQLTTDSSKTAAPLKPSQINSDNFYLTIPSVALNLLESDSDNKIIAKPNLRGIDGEKISYMVGDEVPIPQTQYSGFAAGGVSTVPITTYQYKNVGVDIKVTPTIHQNNEVTLDIELTINFLSGSGFATEFPVLGKREIKAKFRLKENETNIIGGFIRDDIRKSLSGLPALARIPILGKLFGSTENTIQQTDLIFSITPRIIRQISIKEKNLEPVWINQDRKESSVSAPPEGFPRGERQDMMMPPQPQPQRNALAITPSQARVQMNGEAVFSVNLQADSPISTLAVGGRLQDGGEITDVKVDFFDTSVKTMKYASGASFNAGFTCTDANRPLQNTIILQVKVKFSNRGTFSLSVECTSAMDSKQRPVSLAPALARINVY